ncbi:hypothetical protein AXY43_23060 [Clostridium sp. MF28]|uniref:hypothetical protein n=1 Tax=Clostridium TaxID=1485 RepID=UPI000CFA3AE4|nr:MULTISPECIES: hypothetical protein [Clostridium]AVK50662.1 hypothetical protein AXY43_23060 [Clostridium sp. MF28]PSM59008.1 hypothetical protein C4L39_03885 [Clostridium diolis]
MSKVSCVACGRIHERNYICDAKKKAKLDKVAKNRDREDSKIYISNRWRQLRINILEDYNYICLFSYYVFSKIIQANELHHIVWLIDNIDLAFDADNIIPLEHNVHRSIIHNYSNKSNEIKNDIQNMLRDMISDWSNDRRDLGSYKERWENITKDC